MPLKPDTEFLPLQQEASSGTSTGLPDLPCLVSLSDGCAGIYFDVVDIQQIATSGKWLNNSFINGCATLFQAMLSPSQSYAIFSMHYSQHTFWTGFNLLVWATALRGKSKADVFTYGQWCRKPGVAECSWLAAVCRHAVVVCPGLASRGLGVFLGWFCTTLSWVCSDSGYGCDWSPSWSQSSFCYEAMDVEGVRAVLSMFLHITILIQIEQFFEQCCHADHNKLLGHLNVHV